MSNEDRTLKEHTRFEELAAMATLDALTAVEWAELQAHLQTCQECREDYRQYRILGEQGMPLLAADYEHAEAPASWDHRATRATLLAKIERPEPQTSTPQKAQVPARAKLHQALSGNRLLRTAALVFLSLATGVGGYYLRGRTDFGAKQALAKAASSARHDEQELASEKKALAHQLAAQTSKVVKLEAEGLHKQDEITGLRSQLQTLDHHSDELAAAKASSDQELRNVSEQRDALNVRVRNMDGSYQQLQAELANLRAERDKTALELTTLGMRIDELTAVNRDQELHLKNDERYLSSDRDIRELMGARNLYIADVFEVDSASHKRSPFGRVFYTQGKSLIFYAFDLDRQRGVNNAVFQAWGEKDLPLGEKAQPVNLGILYMDNQTNRRWALRCDDPKQLAEISAVFVTVEPPGGSSKPTSKAFLYALLRNEANHP
jgi:hypothetical protein